MHKIKNQLNGVHHLESQGDVSSVGNVAKVVIVASVRNRRLGSNRHICLGIVARFGNRPLCWESSLMLGIVALFGTVALFEIVALVWNRRLGWNRCLGTS